MVINVGVPYVIMLTLCDNIGEPFEYHEEFLSLQPIMFQPKPFDCSGGLASGIGHRVKYFFRLGSQYVECEKQRRSRCVHIFL